MSNIKLAVILAAGLGNRMHPFTMNQPKGFLAIDGVPLVVRSIENLLKTGIEEIIIGTGHKSERFEELAASYPVTCKYNPDYAHTGSMYTLYSMRELIQSSFIMLESDLLYDRSGLEVLIKESNPNIVLASGFTGAGDEVFLEVNQGGYLAGVSKQRAHLKSVFGELTGITKISLPALNAMNKFARENFSIMPKLDYEYAMAAVSGSNKFYVLKIEDYAWCEIDDHHHLTRARNQVWPRITARDDSIIKR